VAKAHFSTTLVKTYQPHTITLHLEFVRRTQVGKAQFKVTDVKVGRATSTIQINLVQDGRLEVLGYITNSNMEKAIGPSLQTWWTLDPLPAPVDLKVLGQGSSKDWIDCGDLPFAAFRRATSHMRFFFPKPTTTAPVFADQWMCFKNGEKFTNRTLGLVADMFPQIPQVYNSESNSDAATGPGPAKYWYPTMLLNLDVKKVLPDEGVDWLFVRTRSKLIKDGRFDLEVIIMDETGDMVALSHQVCMVLPASRNLAERKQTLKDSKL